jgi:hypothetical protein
MVRIMIGGHPVDLMVDTDAEHSVVIQQWAPFHRSIQLLLGLEGTRSTAPSLCPDNAILGVIK